MSEGWPLKTVEINVTQELWKQIELFAERTNGHLANTPGRLLRAGLAAEYEKYPKLTEKDDG